MKTILHPKQLLQLLKQFLKSNSNYFIFFATFTVAVLLLVFIDNKYIVNSIKVVGLSKKVDFAGLNEINNQRIWKLNENEIIESLAIKNPAYTISSVEINYPDSVLINTYLRLHRAYLSNDEGFFILSDDAIIIGKVREKTENSIPTINYYQSIPFSAYQMGSSIGQKDIVDAVEFLDLVQRAREHVTSIDITGFYMLGLYTEEHEYLFSSEKDTSLQMYQFEQAVRQFQADGTEYKILDLRFDKPIVKF